MIQQIIAWALVAVAAYIVLRHVWQEAKGIISPEDAGVCPGCNACDAGAAPNKGVRPAPEVKMTPLVALSKERSAHLIDKDAAG